MSAANVRPIRAPKATTSGSLAAAVIERIDEARNLIFMTLSITAVTAAAAVSDMPVADEHCTETTLRFVSDTLDKVAAMINPTALAQIAANSEVSRDEH